LIALAISPFSSGAKSVLDSFVPLLQKNLGATTEKTDECRVKEILEKTGVFFWRH
jgi:hypothetical protein